MNPSSHRHEAPWYRGRIGIVLLVFLAIAGYFVVTEHWAHVVPVLPWVLLLACPLLHVFMHGGHGGHGGRGDAGYPGQDGGQSSKDQKESSKQKPAPPANHGGHSHV